MRNAYLFFHCNLEFSSIPVADRPTVIDRCYSQLLNIAEELDIPLGIELTGITLEHINSYNPGWIDRFKRLLGQNKCELIASGYAQVIGPLVPYPLNTWNQKIGVATYQRLLGCTPQIALANEMVFSSGLLDVYIDAGYKALIVDRRNLPYPNTPTALLSASGRSLPLLWADSILFQRLQRHVHGELCAELYLDHLSMIAAKYPGPIPIYSSDGEIFDYRPARFHTEAQLKQDRGEWNRLKAMLLRLRDQHGYRWISPSAAFQELSELTSTQKAVSVHSAKMPLPVKKQAKYQVSRWAISGRNDLWLNTACHRFYRTLLSRPDLKDNSQAWKTLCTVWGSDFRTHIEEKRWQSLQHELATCSTAWDTPLPENGTYCDDSSEERNFNVPGVSFNSERTLLHITTPHVKLTLNTKRGFAIESLSFASMGFTPLVGTIPQGYFDHITQGVDYYSCSTVIELPKMQRKITDLSASEAEIYQSGSSLYIRGRVNTELGVIEKIYALDQDSEELQFTTRFINWTRPFGTVRIIGPTLLPAAWQSEITMHCKNGGETLEAFPLNEEVRHDQAINCIVSNSTGIGATDGTLTFTCKEASVKLQWDPASCAAFPMLVHIKAAPSHLTRVFFSLAEVDETSRDGGTLLDFSLRITPNQPTS